jgi:hypothetical protein
MFNNILNDFGCSQLSYKRIVGRTLRSLGIRLDKIASIEGI